LELSVDRSSVRGWLMLARLRGERDKLGELRGRGMAVGRSGERWVPPVEVVGELVVEDPDTDLQQEVRATRGQRICCFLTMRLLTSWLTADSTNEVEMVSPAR
jgi:hypothetical protein